MEDPEDSREEQSEEGRIGGQVRERDWNLDFAVQARYYSGVLQFWGARCFFCYIQVQTLTIFLYIPSQ